jgi:hypothetical protein
MKKHTRVKLLISPAGGPEYTRKIFLEGFDSSYLLKSDIESIFEWGCKYNYFIREAMEDSHYGILNYWNVISFECIDDCRLGLEWALNMISIKEGLRKNKDTENKWLPENFWLSPKGEVFEVESHFCFADKWFDKNIPKDKIKELWENSKNSDSYCEWLTQMGWVRFQGWTRKSTIYYHKPLNPNQWRIIIRYCQQYNLNIDNAILKIN